MMTTQPVTLHSEAIANATGATISCHRAAYVVVQVERTGSVQYTLTLNGSADGSNYQNIIGRDLTATSETYVQSVAHTDGDMMIRINCRGLRKIQLPLSSVSAGDASNYVNVTTTLYYE